MNYAAHALRDIRSGKANVALLTYGSTAHSNALAIGAGGGGGACHLAIIWKPCRANISSQLRDGCAATYARIRDN